MKKCKGCGIELQYENKDSLGFAPNESFDYCQRCFRLTHYGDINDFNKVLRDNTSIIDYYKEIKDALFVLIVDCFDALIIDDDYLLEAFKDKDVLLIINKLDLLPKNITEDKIEKLYISALRKYANNTNINCLLTYKNDYTFIDLFFETINNIGIKKLVFVGRVNAGKSTIINKLTRNKDLTTSIYPGTTMDFNEIKFNDYTFIDTPGLLDEESFISYIDNSLIKEILPLNTLKAQNFQVYDEQTYSLEGLFGVTIKPYKNATVVFMINNNLEIHRTKACNFETYMERNTDSFKLKLLPYKDNHYKVNKIKTFYLKGVGLFKISGKCDVIISVNDRIKIYSNEVNI